MVTVLRTVAETANDRWIPPSIAERTHATDFSGSAGALDFLWRVWLADEIGVVVLIVEWRQEIRRLRLWCPTRRASARRVEWTRHIALESVKSVYHSSCSAKQ